MNWCLGVRVGLAGAAVLAVIGANDTGRSWWQVRAAAAESTTPAAAAAKDTTWIVPDVDALPADDWGKLVRLGRDLTAHTDALIGPDAADAAKRFTGNHMTCQNCHLEAGTKKLGLPFIGVFADFPQYRPREGEVGTLEDRINGCMTRSMNGHVLPLDAREMKAFVAYIKFLSMGRPIGGPTPGRGSGDMAELTRPADPVAGAKVYVENCVACHGADGQGKRVKAAAVNDEPTTYDIPPLWGDDSYNDGAGMARLISAANFIHSNMPNGTTADHPVLSIDDAWDVAAFVDTRPRPRKDALANDYPNRFDKAADAAYGPFPDGFGDEQHRLGPFQPIRDKLKQLRQAAAAKSVAQ